MAIYIVGVYYWIRVDAVWSPNWILCKCISTPHFGDGVGFQPWDSKEVYTTDQIKASQYVRQPEYR